MKHKIILFFLLINLASNAYPRTMAIPSGGRAAGMGNAYVSQSGVFSVYHNPAGTSAIDKMALSIFYESRFHVEYLSVKAITATIPTSAGNFSFQFNSFGAPEWAESNAGLTYALNLSKKLSAGLQIHYYGRRLPEANILVMNAGFETGAIYQITERTHLGANVANLLTPKIRDTHYTEQIPWVIRAGGHTAFTHDFILSYEAEQMENEKLNLKLGGEWQASNGIFFRGGFNTSPSKIFAGFGYTNETIFFDIAFSNHHNLGYVTSASISLML
ncbi:MAG: hypothetical protein PF436_12955 [Prolixibacteraceae bacterium]|jgi:hypothetical protein|nr:hypothetical protein [Prolixibacteraceae bacterium]